MLEAGSTKHKVGLGTCIYLPLEKFMFQSDAAPMNSENGLPPEVQKFLDTHLRTDAQRRLFLEEYSRLTNERERQAFLARYLDDVPDETGPEAARRKMEETIAKREQNRRN
jgi:hypothetical protein